MHRYCHAISIYQIPSLLFVENEVHKEWKCSLAQNKWFAVQKVQVVVKKRTVIFPRKRINMLSSRKPSSSNKDFLHFLHAHRLPIFML